MQNIIEININDYQDVIDKFDNDKLSNELASFICRQYNALSLHKSVEINVKSSNLTEEQEKNIANMIHKYFGLETKKSILTFRYKIK